MNPTHRSSPALRWLAAGAGLATALYATRAGFTWLQYGYPPSPDMDETDRLLNEFIPTYEVVERHHVRVAAPAAVALAAACDMDLAQSNPVFRPLPPQEFARFHEPGYAKIVWTLRADPINATESIASTETRVATTDLAARKAFRRYWSLVSPGVEVIRWVSLRLVKREAEGRMPCSQGVYRTALNDEPIHQASR